MAEWNKNKANPSSINNGKEFTTNDDLAVNELNAMVNNSFYAVDFAEAMADEPDISEANNIGTPSVSFVNNVKDGKTFKRFKFSNLKGEKGDAGDRGEKGEKGESGDSNAFIKYLGNVTIGQMSIKDFYSLLYSTFGASCKTYYLVTIGGFHGTNGSPIIVSNSTDDVVSSDNLLAYLMNKWTGECTQLHIKEVETNNALVRVGSDAIFNYTPLVACDYIELTSFWVEESSTKRYNLKYAWAGYELNVIDAYGGTSTYIKSPSAGIRVYGLVV